MSDIVAENVGSGVEYGKPGFFKRLLWAFTSPGRLMAVLAEKPKLLFCLLAGALAPVVLYAARMPLYVDMLREQSMAQLDSGLYESFGIEMTPEMIEEGLPASTVVGLVSTPFTVILRLLISAFVFYAILKIIGGKGKFKAYFSVAAHANLIAVLYTLFCIPISFVSGSFHDTVRLTSLATLAPAGIAGTALYGVLAGIDIFAIWQYTVMAIGFAEVSKLKKKYVYGIVAGVFIIGMLINLPTYMVLKTVM